MLVRRVILITLITTAFAYGGDIIPIGQPDTELFFEYQRELYLRGAARYSSVTFMPSFADDITDKSSKRLDRIIEPLVRLAARYRSEPNEMTVDALIMPHGLYNDDRNGNYLAFSPALRYGISDKIALAVSYWIDGSLADEPLYEGKKWGDFAGYVNHAVISYRTKKLTFDIGRRRSGWGIASGGESLILSTSAMPMDGLFFNYDFAGWLSIHSIIAYLSPLRGGAPFSEGEPTENRYFSAHALRISPFSWWDIALKESVIYGGPGRRLEPAYMFPLIWYHAEQLNSGADDNTFFELETVVRWRNRYAAYCELLIDDYQIEKESASDNEPDEIGIVAGLDFFDWPFESSAWELEYTRINNYTYNQMNPRNAYINQNFPIGHSLGPDHESLKLSYTHHFKYGLTAKIETYVTNRGEGRLGEDWIAPWLVDPDYHEKFPSGVVEKTFGGQFNLYYIKNESLKGKLSIDIADIKNNGNISGANETLWSANIQLIAHLPKFSWRGNND